MPKTFAKVAVQIFPARLFWLRSQGFIIQPRLTKKTSAIRFHSGRSMPSLGYKSLTWRSTIISLTKTSVIMAKNVTYGYFERRRPDAVITAFFGVAPTDRTPIHRLSWYPDEVPMDWGSFAKTISDSATPDAVFVLDSSFLDRHEIPDAVWSALGSRKLLFTPGIWAELEPWRATPFAHASFRDRVLAAFEAGDQAVSLLSDTDWDDPIKKSAAYYVSLLAARKLFGHEVIAAFVAEKGREPTSEEVLAECQSKVRDRGLFLAIKGLEDHRKVNFLADEELVVFAITHAILTGRQTTILTRDKDVLEQFYKALYLLDTHYRSHLIAQAFGDTPENLIPDQLSIPSDHDFLFEDRPLTLHLPRRFSEWVLPSEWNGVNIGCVRLGGQGDQMKATSLTFHAEREMRSVFQIKGISAGKNAALPSEANCHILVSPPFSPGLGGHAIVAKDCQVSIGTFTGPLVDLNYAIMEIEGFKTMSPVTGIESDELPQGCKLADYCLIDRLTYSPPPVWIELPDSELARALSLLNPATICFTDLGFLATDHGSDVESVLLTKGFATTSSIRDAIASATVGQPLSKLSSSVVKKSKSPVEIYDVKDDLAHSLGFGHYLGLLAFRKMFFKVMESDILKESGRTPSAEECLSRIENVAGELGRRLAEDGHRRIGDSSLFFGEELLVTSLLAGILHGTDVVLLTHEPLLMEQFVKLCGAVSTDYSAYTFWKSEPADIKKRMARLDSLAGPKLEGLYQSPVLHIDLGETWKHAGVPKNPYLVNLHCWLLGMSRNGTPQIAAMSFCAERPMFGLLKTKSEFDGRNISDPSGMNLRLGFSGSTGGNAVAQIGRDRIVPYGARSFPMDQRLNLKIKGLPAVDLMIAIGGKTNATLPCLATSSS